jgi:hypothetical protein
MRNHLPRLLLATLPALALTACDGGEPTSELSDTDANLSSGFGGQTTSSEAPSFGDTAFAATDLATAPTDVADTATTGTPAIDGAARLRVLVAWGFPKPQPEATQVVDWSGSIAVTNGALRVVRRWHFEPNDDVIRPRTDIHTVEFTSHTRPASDGLLLEGFTGPRLNPTNSTVALTFTSPVITDTITLEKGMRLSEVVPVDAAGHVLSFHVIRPDTDACHEGFLRGHWTVDGAVGDRELGTLVGRMETSDGTLRGELKGVFGKRKDGRSLFFAKVIDANGQFVALIAGTYGDGEFKGRVLVGADHTIDGRVAGHIADDDSFLGRWSQKCGEDKDEGAPMTSDSQPAVDSGA